MSGKGEFWFRVPLTETDKRDNAGHVPTTINKTGIIVVVVAVVAGILSVCYDIELVYSKKARNTFFFSINH